MPDAKAIARIDFLAWTLIFGGLLGVVLGLAAMSRSPGAAWALIGVGTVATLGGAVLIWVRSRFDDDKKE